MPPNRPQNSALGAWGESASVRRQYGYPSPRPASAAVLQRRIEDLERGQDELRQMIERLLRERLP